MIVVGAVVHVEAVIARRMVLLDRLVLFGIDIEPRGIVSKQFAAVRIDDDLVLERRPLRVDYLLCVWHRAVEVELLREGGVLVPSGERAVCDVAPAPVQIGVGDVVRGKRRLKGHDLAGVAQDVVSVVVGELVHQFVLVALKADFQLAVETGRIILRDGAGVVGYRGVLPAAAICLVLHCLEAAVLVGDLETATAHLHGVRIIVRPTVFTILVGAVDCLLVEIDGLIV